MLVSSGCSSTKGSCSKFQTGCWVMGCCMTSNILIKASPQINQTIAVRFTSVVVRCAFHQFNLDVVRTLNKRRLASGTRVGTPGDFDPIFFQPIEGLLEVVHAEGDVVGGVA